MKILLVSLLAFAAVQSAPQELNGQAMVDHINSNNKLWTAKLNTDFNLEGRIVSHEAPRLQFNIRKKVPKIRECSDIPKEFDARTQWSKCESISKIQDQSNCASAWAVVPAAVISDRICIANDESTNQIYSALDVLTCGARSGCTGGSHLDAFGMWNGIGIVTGSSYKENSGCRPYPFPPCNGTYTDTEEMIGGRITACQKEFETPNCEYECQASYSGEYYADKSHGDIYVVDSTVEEIQKEIMTHGPVSVKMEVYSDFKHYSGGIYVYTFGRLEGTQTVRIIGWGIEDDIDYWLVANSWGPNWGESGFFRIYRGENHCLIEDEVVAGIPM